MAAKWRMLCWCILNFMFLTGFHAFFDIDELKSTNYGIDILNEPVVMDTEAKEASTSVQLTSKYGQLYQCSFPDQAQQEKEKEEQEKVAMETGIPDLLKPMESGPCLKKTKDWWSYELCYGQHVRQFHIGEDGSIQGEIIYLGLYESEFDWNNETNQEIATKHKSRLNRYHTQQYVNGSKCDLTGQLRRVEVRFLCEEGSGDYIARLDEPETCVYIMTVHTTKICHHPYLKPPTPTKTVPIICNPLLSVQQYQDYIDQMEAAEEAKRLKEERLKQEEEDRKVAEEKLKYLKKSSIESGEGWDEDEEEVEVEGEGEGDELEGFSQRKRPGHTHGMDDSRKSPHPKLGKDQNMEMKMVIKMVDSPKDLDDFIKEMNEVTDENAKKPDDDAKSEMEDMIDEREDEEDDLLEDYESELKTIKDRYKDRRDRLTAMKEKVRDTMEKQFGDILQEAQSEIEGDSEILTETEKKKAFETLSKSLNNLIDKLDKTEKEISEVDRELGEFASYEHETEADKTSKPKAPPLKTAGEATHDNLPKGPGKTLGDGDDGPVRVRVTKLKKGQLTKEGEEISNKQTDALEKSVQKGLQEAGLGSEGTKIQVKIITAGYLDDKDDSVHILSEEDTEAFRNMIVSIIGGSSEASKEEHRHNQLEENYKFVWGTDQQKEPSDQQKQPSDSPDQREPAEAVEET